MPNFMKIVVLLLLVPLAACSSGAGGGVGAFNLDADPQQPGNLARGFLWSLYSAQFTQAKTYVAPSELESIARLTRITALDEDLYWPKVTREYTQGCSLSDIVIEGNVVSSTSARVDYVLRSGSCLPLRGSLNLTLSQGRWYVSFVRIPLEVQDHIRTLTQNYARAIHKAAQDALRDNSALTPSGLATADCTRGYVAGNYLVTTHASLLASCRVNAVGSGLFVVATNLLGRTVTVPTPSN